ncbi:MAG: hypothetical protein [Caudoviricetes sp.]|nr:MAG: hypothetical protein [Caudoviricetes sp.]
MEVKIICVLAAFFLAIVIIFALVVAKLIETVRKLEYFIEKQFSLQRYDIESILIEFSKKEAEYSPSYRANHIYKDSSPKRTP